MNDVKNGRSSDLLLLRRLPGPVIGPVAYRVSQHLSCKGAKAYSYGDSS